ncbi:MAG: glycosyltransferase family 4 protein [Chlamydiae bacterium]|nr:glycosyltransferase family 4 protein [Chlamydiota bacterium]MBI3278185.1 glycosyltransferase family 4 protein [Chlamydiota bacterium]
MRIGIDARWITKEPSGIGQYTIQLIKHLILHDSQNEYFLFFSRREIEHRVSQEFSIGEKKNFHVVSFPYSVFSLRSQIFLPLKLRFLKIDLFHSTNFMTSLLTFQTRQIITVHDLIPFLFPEFAPRSKKSRYYKIYRFLLKMILKKVDHVFLDSEHSYRDLIRYFPSMESKASVLTFGIDSSFKRGTPSESKIGIRERFGIEGPILLYVGRQDPYKNLMNLVKIFHQLLPNKPNAVLILAGPEDVRYPELRELIRRLNLEKKVLVTGFLSQEELVRLYQEATFFLLPSLYEGFGLPILEAFACGVPVIASKVASIPEVVGEAGVLLDPQNEGAWVDAISNLLKCKEEREFLIQKGFEQLKNFSWDKAVDQVLKNYADIYENPKIKYQKSCRTM